jgi:hypothetical protein
MTTTRTWIGGGNNEASNPNDWSPTGVPQPCDTLLIGTPAFQFFTMNIRGNDLTDDAIEVGPPTGSLIANLSDQAVVSTSVVENRATFNVSGHSNLTVSEFRADLTVNLSQHSTFDLNPGGSGSFGTIVANVSGHDTAVINNGSDGGVTVHLAKGARLSGTLVSRGDLSMDGAAGSVFNNDGDSSFDAPATVTLGVDVTGTGGISTPTSSFRFAKLEFAKSVGPHQSIFDGDIVQIDQPYKFAASVTMTSTSSEIDLMGLATADSYSYSKDMLKVWSGDKIIDRLRLTDQTPYGFDLVKTSGSVNVVALGSNGQTLPGALPIHVGT